MLVAARAGAAGVLLIPIGTLSFDGASLTDPNTLLAFGGSGTDFAVSDMEPKTPPAAVEAGLVAFRELNVEELADGLATFVGAVF